MLLLHNTFQLSTYALYVSMSLGALCDLSACVCITFILANFQNEILNNNVANTNEHRHK